jgi:hypothetical protein
VTLVGVRDEGAPLRASVEDADATSTWHRWSWNRPASIVTWDSAAQAMWCGLLRATDPYEITHASSGS